MFPMAEKIGTFQSSTMHNESDAEKLVTVRTVSGMATT
jgi:hypothetical protein